MRVVLGRDIAVVLTAVLMFTGCGKGPAFSAAVRDQSEQKKVSISWDGAPESGLPAVKAASADLATGSGTLSVGGVTFTVPEGWVPQTPSSRVRAAQYSLAGEAGQAELAVFAFGLGQGGSARENIVRWVAQFEFQSSSSPGAKPDLQAAIMEQDGLQVTVAKVSGTYAPVMCPLGQPQSSRAKYALYGLVVEGGPQGTVLVRVIGPQATLDQQALSLDAFTRSTRQAVLMPPGPVAHVNKRGASGFRGAEDGQEH